MNRSVIFFDGVCNLCNSLINILIKIDSKKNLYFSPLQSNFAKTQLQKSELDLEKIDSIVLNKNNKLYIKSDAVIEIIKELRSIYKIFLIAAVLPKRWRDKLYDFIAEKRYNWFGRRNECMIPTDDVKSRFITD